MTAPPRSGSGAPSNSTRSSGPQKASTTKTRAAHHSVSITAAGKVTVLGNGVSLELLAQCPLGSTRPINDHGTREKHRRRSDSVRYVRYFRRANVVAAMPLGDHNGGRRSRSAQVLPGPRS